MNRDILHELLKSTYKDLKSKNLRHRNSARAFMDSPSGHEALSIFSIMYRTPNNTIHYTKTNGRYKRTLSLQARREEYKLFTVDGRINNKGRAKVYN